MTVRAGVQTRLPNGDVILIHGTGNREVTGFVDHGQPVVSVTGYMDSGEPLRVEAESCNEEARVCD